MRDKILLLSPAAFSQNMAGPSIRYWEIAKQLSQHFEVIVLTPNYIPNNNNTKFIIDSLSEKNLFKYSKESKIIIFQGTTLWRYPIIKYLGVPLAIDLYDPFHLENLELFANKRLGRYLYKSTLNILEEQMYLGDYFFCASNKQKDYWLGMLTAFNRVDLEFYKKDRTFTSLIGVVPFGIQEEIPQKREKVIKGIYPQIDHEDLVIIWGGGIWEWLDPELLLHTMKYIKNRQSNIKCFFMGVKPPGTTQISSMLEKLIQLRKELDLEDTVVFNDWVKYDDRDQFLLESDIGISLHKDHIETRYAYRTRILDYIWTDLSVVSLDGDVLSEIIRETNRGVILPRNSSPEIIGETLIGMLNNKIKNANDISKEEFHWRVALKDLREFCQNPVFTSKKKNFFFEIKWFFNRVIYYLLRLYVKNKKN